MKKLLLAVCGIALSGAAFAEGGLITLPVSSAQVSTDFTTAAGVILGVFVVIFAYRVIRRLLGR